MNPFALQEAARKKTGILVALVVAAVVSTIAAAAVAFLAAEWLVVWELACKHKGNVMTFGELCRHPIALLIAVGLALLVVGVGFLLKSDAIASGAKLMKTLGAKRIHRGPATLEVDRLTLFNVCEEMSIASGVDMPSVWVLEGEMGVNAFVAGHSPSESALCVTEGALAYLERDELQGVIAHEFSHILNGDMRLNFRLLMLIAGITAYHRLGKTVFTAFFGDGESNYRPRIRTSGKGGLVVVVLMLVSGLLWLIGSVGTFFARLIQSAVSREREYLADAAAVQFTRNPEGLANALRLTYLAQCSSYGALATWRDDVAHMLFTEGRRPTFATHPPVKDRIARLSSGGIKAGPSLKARIARINADRKARAAANVRRTREGQVRAAVAPQPQKLPPNFNGRLREPGFAGSVLVQLLRGRLPEGLGPTLSAVDRRILVKKCVITIRDLETAPTRAKWCETVEALVKEDGQFDSFEFMATAAARRYLRPGPSPRTVPAGRLRNDAARVLSTVASFGDHPSAGYAAALRCVSLFGGPFPAMPAPYDDALEFLDGLARLEALPPLAKNELLSALGVAAREDGRVSDEEGDYIAAAADAIGAWGWKTAL